MKGPQRIAPGAHPIAREIADHLSARRMSITEIADAAGMERTNIARWFSSSHQPTLRSAEAVSNVIGRTVVLVPMCPLARAREAADWLQAQGWRVEAPPQLQDARAAGGISGHREKPRQGATGAQGNGI